MPNAKPSLKSMIRSGATVLGGFVFSPDPNITEIYAKAGFDFVIIDMEHTLNDLAVVGAHLRAARAAGIHAVVRIGRTNIHDVPRILDAGCLGLMLPHVGVASYGADEALRSTRYAPDGERPTCTGVPAAAFGLSPFADYVERANREVTTFGLVEDKACVDDIDRVLAGGLVDCVMPGPGDLSVSYGVPGQFKHPLVSNAVGRVLEAAKRTATPTGLYISDPSEVEQGRAQGTNVFVLSIDYKLLGAALKSAAGTVRQLAR